MEGSPPSRTIMVLGGGGALGAYQAGTLLALAEAGILPDAVYACSVGALNAAFLASDPSTERAAELANWWADTRTHGVLSPSVWGRVRGLALAAANGASALFDERPLRRLIAGNVPAHDVAELAVPLTVTTTCLDCGDAVHHSRGAVGDVLVASCSLPGLFPPVTLSDGHRHVDGGVVCGVPVEAALAAAGPDDRVLVLDCALAPVTGREGECAALPVEHAAEQEACGLPRASGQRAYQAPVESHRGALQVLPHVADAWAAGLLTTLPAGPRDTTATDALIAAGWQASRAWLRTLGAGDSAGQSTDERAAQRGPHVA